MGTVVYNACYGGFSLSLDAQKLYLEKKGHTPQLHVGRGSWDTHWYINEPNDFYDFKIDRADPILADVVRELGELSNGSCAKLVVCELPKGTAYKIDEYDGFESVVTKDDLEWSIIE